MIKSLQNPKIQLIRKLLARRKDRYKNCLFVLEGVRLIEEAVKTGAQPNMILYSNELTDRGMGVVHEARSAGTEIFLVDSQIISEICDTETPQGLVATFPLQTKPIPNDFDFVLILDNLRDPGNLGSILRTSAAADVQLVLLTRGTVDPYAPKVLRAGMGAHFYLPIHQMSWEDVISLLKEKGKPLSIFTTSLTHGISCWDANLAQPLALVIGNEAQGTSLDADMFADQSIHIPMQGSIESLNASTAAGILLFEVLRQRKQ